MFTDDELILIRKALVKWRGEYVIDWDRKTGEHVIRPDRQDEAKMIESIFSKIDQIKIEAG